MKKFTVRVFDHCRQPSPEKVIEFNNIDEARDMFEKLRNECIPAEIHSHGTHGKMLCVNHPSPYLIEDRVDWAAAELDGWR
jgi:hypothetical protein